MSLKFIALSGTTDVTENFYLYEYANDIIIVDCGVGFPETEMYGVDLVIPDFSYVIENKSKLRGVIISHGHEDHLGALPFFLKEVNTQVYATKLVAGFIEDKLAEHKIKNQKVNVFDPGKDEIKLGSFKITPFRVSHSVPDGVGLAIDTPEGQIFHVPDYKFDWTPVDKKPFDVKKASILASKGVIMLASDCLGATTPGYTESEGHIEERIEEIARKGDKAIFFTTISSNISRIQQALNVAERLGRKVSFVGRSIEVKAEIAKNLGYLHYSQNLVVPMKELTRLPKNKTWYVISGSYGQGGSALYRAAHAEHDFLSIEKGDVVIFSSDPAPPGSKVNVDSLVDSLIETGAEVHYYDMQEDLHVSGHGSQEDIKMLFGLAKPKYFVPIGGTIRHMRAYRDIAVKMGAQEQEVFELKPGEIVEFKNGSAHKAGKIDVKDVLVDGLGIGDVGNVVLRDRQRLAQDGIAIVLMQLDKKAGMLMSSPEIISRGFVFEKKEKGFLQTAGSLLMGELRKKKRVDIRVVRNTSIDFLEKYFYKETGRRPMVLPLVVEI